MKKTFLATSLFSLVFSVAGVAPLAYAAVDCSGTNGVCPAGQYCDPVDFFCKPISGTGVVGSGPNINAITPYSDSIINLINGVLFPLLFSLAFIVFLYGVAKKYVFSRGDEAAIAEGHKLILWGTIGFVVMISIWGIVAVVSNTLGLYGTSAPDLPGTPLAPA